MPKKLETATLAGGCFWCTEAIFLRLKGVHSVMPGYAGGTVDHPTYEQVSAGATGHAEAIQIKFDPEIISYPQLLEVFWHTHNPTTRNQQGNDHGPQYRSVIFYHDERQRTEAEKSRQALTNAGAYPDPIVTEIVPFTNFFVAEDYHRNYFSTHPDAPYCSVVIEPKIKKLMQQFGQQVKEEYQS